MPRWLSYSILTVLLWGVWAFIPRWLATISAEQQQVVSTFGLLPILLILAGWRRRLGGARIKRGCTIAFGAGLIGGIGNVLFYRLLNAGQNAATVVPLTSLYPLVTVVLAMAWLRERLNAIQIAGVGLALISIYCFNIGPEGPLSAGWLGFALLPVGLWGLAGLLQKLCTNDISAELSTLCFLSALVPISLAVWLWTPLSWHLSLREWMLGVALGVFLGLGNLTLLAAFASGGKAAVVSPLSGLYSVVTVPLAVGVLGEHVSRQQWLGIALALVAVVALGMASPDEAVAEAGGFPTD